MCIIFKKGIGLYCPNCKTESAHFRTRIMNCKKAQYSCLNCGMINGFRHRKESIPDK